MDKRSVFSKDGKHRFYLSRIWDKDKPLILYVGLNPSTADDKKDDPTIKKLIKLTKFNGYGGFYIVNLMSLIEPKPYILIEKKLPEVRKRSKNSRYINNLTQICEDICLMWGVNGKTMRLDREFVNNWGNWDPNGLLCFDQNNDNSPKHPLYISSETKLKQFR